MKHQWKSIGNPVKIAIKKNWNFNEIPMEINWISSWNFNKIKMEIHWTFNSYFNGIPVGSIVNPVKISIIYQLKFQSNDNRN